MPIENGLVLDGYHDLADICKPLGSNLSRCFWVVDCQSGPWKSSWYHESDENQKVAERQWWDVPALENTSTFGLRPRTIPQLADRLIVDEWSYYFAIDAPEQEALAKATALASHIGDFSQAFLRTLDSLADLFICHGDGWWEFYCGRPDWSLRFKAAWPECQERSLKKAGTPP